MPRDLCFAPMAMPMTSQSTLDETDLCETCAPFIRKAALAILRRTDACPADCDDVVQLTFLRLFTQLRGSQYQETGRLEAYACRIARNAAWDIVRRRRRELPALVVPEISNSWAPAIDDSHLLTEQICARLSSNRQGPLLRELFFLRCVFCCSQQTAARVLNTTRQRVRTLERQLVEILSRETQGASRSKWRGK